MITSWLLTSFLFPKNKFDVLLTEEPYLPIALMRSLRLIKKRKKLISQLGTHTLYFIKANRYGDFTKKMFLYTFSKYDVIICEGEMQKEILISLLSEYKKKPIIKTISNGSTETRVEKLLLVKPNLKSNKILSIAETPNNDRVFYKGLDLNIAAFKLLILANKDYYYDIIGTVPVAIQKILLDDLEPKIKNRIRFLGRVNNFESILADYSLCLHLARGEAWGVSINECLLAGLPTIVSEWTGSKEMVCKVSEDLIVPLNAEKAKKAMLKYFELEFTDKLNLSNKCRSISKNYTENKAVEQFKSHFYESIK
jgi:glycosyltransferase involved in cell wall biosynthesis